MDNSNRAPFGDDDSANSGSSKCIRCNSLIQFTDAKNDLLVQGCTHCPRGRDSTPVAGPSGTNRFHSSLKRKLNSPEESSSPSLPKTAKSDLPTDSGPPATKTSKEQPIPHVIRHLLGFKCTICGKEFSSRSNRSYHRYCDKSVRKPFQCGTCEKVTGLNMVFY